MMSCNLILCNINVVNSQYSRNGKGQCLNLYVIPNVQYVRRKEQ